MELNAKDKANELYELYYYAPDEDGYHSSNRYRAKVQAIICCDQVLKLMIIEFKWDKKHNGNIDYWQDVRDVLEDINTSS
jgi:hypothetical protein